MNCLQCRELLDSLIVDEMDESTEAAFHGHLAQCDKCVREFAAAKQALALLTPAADLRASPELKENIMNAIADTVPESVIPIRSRLPAVRIRRWAVVATAAAATLIAAVRVLSPGPGLAPRGGFSAFELFATACAAEELDFVGDNVIYIENEICVRPTDDPNRVNTRWLPLVSLDSSGEARFHQLVLAAERGQGYSIKDESWYDPLSGRFARLLTVDDMPLFANAYDGEAVYTLEPAEGATSNVIGRKVSEDFEAPANPAEYLGIATGFRTSMSEKNGQDFSDAGEATLDDGTRARVLKAGLTKPAGDAPLTDEHYLFTIRADDNTIVKMEFFSGHESLLLVKRVRRESVEQPGVAWDLAGLEGRVVEAESKTPVRITPNMVLLDLTIEEMVERADFKTYVFSEDPAWASERQIADILDLVSPPKRMFIISHKADDGRHVVLFQADFCNTMLGPMAAESGRIIHTSPSGIKVLSSSRDKWHGQVLLQSARAWIGPADSDDRTCYLLQTPSGSFPALAINGSITDDELHTLIDNLVLAREHVDYGDSEDYDRRE